MPKSNEELAAGEAAPAPVPMPVDSVSEVDDQLASTKLSDQDEVNEQLESVKLSTQDEAQPPADATAGDTDTNEDPDLWKPPPPTEECPVCMVPLPLRKEKSAYWSCCGKVLCTACCDEHDRALRVTNMKREKKKQPPLEQTCAFCRRPIYKNDAEMLSLFEKRVDKGDIQAMVSLGQKYVDGSNGLRKNDEKAFKLLQMAADLGSAEAFAELGCWVAKKGLSSTHNRRKAKVYYEEAAKRGYAPSRHILARLLADEGNIDLAIKHWHLAAAAGHDKSMECLWKSFYKGNLRKPELEKALRAHKTACDEMNSEERERCDASQEAFAGNDTLLNNIYVSYYLGFINSMELKVALKHHRAGNVMAVEALLNKKVPANR